MDKQAIELKLDFYSFNYYTEIINLTRLVTSNKHIYMMSAYSFNFITIIRNMCPRRKHIHGESDMHSTFLQGLKYWLNKRT